MKHTYEDIIFLPRPVSKNHPPMSLQDRAAQFSPFAALTGYGELIKETADQINQDSEDDLSSLSFEEK